MTADDIVVGRVYSAKRPQRVGLIFPKMNDRQVVWVSADRTIVQYDSPTVKLGRRLPTLPMDKFLAWAAGDVTVQCSEGSWRFAP